MYILFADIYKLNKTMQEANRWNDKQDSEEWLPRNGGQGKQRGHTIGCRLLSRSEIHVEHLTDNKNHQKYVPRDSDH